MTTKYQNMRHCCQINYPADDKQPIIIFHINQNMKVIHIHTHDTLKTKFPNILINTLIHIILKISYLGSKYAKHVHKFNQVRS